jgi:hypothetical protein
VTSKKLVYNLSEKLRSTLFSLRICLDKKTVASALREVSNKQVAAWLRMTHKAEGLVEF